MSEILVMPTKELCVVKVEMDPGYVSIALDGYIKCFCSKWVYVGKTTQKNIQRVPVEKDSKGDAFLHRCELEINRNQTLRKLLGIREFAQSANPRK